MVINKIKNVVSKNKNLPEHIVALDIGTEYVKVLIGKVVQSDGKQKIIEITGLGKKHQRLSDMYSGAIADISGVVDNCDVAIAEAEDMSGITARNVVIGIAGELVKGTTTTLQYKRQAPDKPLENAELRTIVERVQDRALERAKAQMAWESATSDVELKLVNAAVVNVSIDGYKVTNPLGFQGKDISIQLFTAFAPMVHISAIERVAYDLDLNLINVSAEPFAVAKSVGVDAAESFNAIFIDVGGGTTDIAVVNDGGVEGTRMFGIGGRSFTNSIAKALSCSFEEAERTKLKFVNKELEEGKTESVKKALLATLKVWISGVELALSEFENIDQLPSKILLCGGGTGLPYIKDALETDKWRKNLPFAKNLSVAHINTDQVDAVIDKTSKVNDYTYITPMGLLNAGLDSILNGPVSQSMLKKLNRTLQV